MSASTHPTHPWLVPRFASGPRRAAPGLSVASHLVAALSYPGRMRRVGGRALRRVLATLPLAPSAAMSSSRALAALFCTLFYQSKTHPMSFQLFPFILSLEGHSSQNHPECHPERHFNSSSLNCSASSPATPSESTLVDVLRVLPCFGRNCPLATPVESILTDFTPVTPLSATLTENRGRSLARLRTDRLPRQSFDRHREAAITVVHGSYRDRLPRREPLRSNEPPALPCRHPFSAVLLSPPRPGPSTANSPRRCLP